VSRCVGVLDERPSPRRWPAAGHRKAEPPADSGGHRPGGDARIGQSACPLPFARMAPLAGRGPVARCQPIALAGAPPAKIAERRGMLVAQLQRDLGRVFDVVVRESPERQTRNVRRPTGRNKSPADASRAPISGPLLLVEAGSRGCDPVAAHVSGSPGAMYFH
jgi:hypothetical protein